MSDPLDAAALAEWLKQFAGSPRTTISEADCLYQVARALLAERKAREQLERICWLAAEEDSWFGHEDDVKAQREAAKHYAERAKGKVKS